MEQYVKLTGSAWSKEMKGHTYVVTETRRDHWVIKCDGLDWYVYRPEIDSDWGGILVDGPEDTSSDEKFFNALAESKQITGTAELDALAEKIFLSTLSASPHNFTHLLYGDTMKEVVDESYEIAKQFIELKKSRKQ